MSLRAAPTRSVWLVRHAQASIDADEYDCLSAHGRGQAQLLGLHLAATGLNATHAECGTLERQRDTLSLALAELPQAPLVSESHGWNELDAIGMLRAQTPEHANLASLRRALAAAASPDMAFVALLGRALTSWQAGTLAEDACAETWPAFRARVAAALERCATAARERSDGDTLIVSSGGVIVTAAAIVRGAPDADVFASTHRMANTGITRIALDADGWRVDTFNDYAWLAHHDPEAVTWR